MFKYFSVIFFALSLSVHAEVPVCDFPMTVTPCSTPKEEIYPSIINMMLENQKGMKLVKKTGKYGLLLSHFSGESFKITVTNFKQMEDEQFEMTTKYEIQLSDSGGGDVIDGEYLWTVIETSKGDVYGASRKYKNTISKIAK